MRSNSQVLYVATVAGLATFLGVVVLLQWVQPDYVYSTQFMSELALGKFGMLMTLAFLGLSMAIMASSANIYFTRQSRLLPLLLGAASACILAAGLITLDVSMQFHVLLMATAFIFCGTSMYLLPLVQSAFSSIRSRLISWGFCLAMVLATGLGGNILMPGVAQRISATALLLWLFFVARRSRQIQ